MSFFNEPPDAVSDSGGGEMIEQFADHLADVLEDMAKPNPNVAAIAVTYLKLDGDDGHMHAGCQIIGFTPEAIEVLGILGANIMMEYTEEHMGALEDLFEEGEDDDDLLS